MAKLKHLRHVKRGTRHVHSCPCCSRWRVKPAVCTLVECDIIGVYANCESIDPGQRFPLGGRDKVCAACEAEFAHARAIEVLHAIGEAVATVARALIIAHAIDHRGIRGEHSAAYYGPEQTWLVYLGDAQEPSLEIHSPDPADRAAEVVALVISIASTR